MMENNLCKKLTLTSSLTLSANRLSLKTSSSVSNLSNLSNITLSNRKDVAATSTKSKCVDKNGLKKILFKGTSNSQLHLSAKKKPLQQNGNILNDRYIPNRVTSYMEASYHLYHSNNNSSASFKLNDSSINASDSNDSDVQVDNVKRKLIVESCNGLQDKAKILPLHNKPHDSDQAFADNIKSFYNNNILSSKKKSAIRYIPSTPERILDAPEFRDDYYLNLIDWSATNNLAVALNKDMYLWNASTGDILLLFSMDNEAGSPDEMRNDYITSASWLPHKDNILAVGNSKHVIQIWDAEKECCIRQMKSHTSRVGALAWNNYILSSGSRSGEIHNHDVRVKNHHVGTLGFHTQEICGLKWSLDGRHLASGSNDNKVSIWDYNIMNNEAMPLQVFTEHTAAVKAVSWCPWQSNLIATGGGTFDGKIKIWNIYNGNVQHTVDAKSQISCILWSKNYKELISSHGFQQNQLTIWKYQDMSKVYELNGHTNRVLQMAMSPDEEMVASVGADETLRLWNCFGIDDKSKRNRETSIFSNKSYANLSTRIR